jgi:hypothetical protein
LKHLQEAVGNILEQIGIRNDFLSKTQKAQHQRERTNKWDCIKLKSFCTAKETVTRLKVLPTESEKIFARYSSDIIYRIYRELKKLNLCKINILMKKWAHEFSREEVQMARKYMKKYSTSLAVKEMQIKTTLRFHLILIRIAIFKGNNTSKCW